MLPFSYHSLLISFTRGVAPLFPGTWSTFINIHSDLDFALLDLSVAVSPADLSSYLKLALISSCNTTVLGFTLNHRLFNSRAPLVSPPSVWPLDIRVPLTRT